MANREKKKENVLIKVYIFVLFLCGIGLWFAVSNTGTHKQKITVDVELEQKLVDTLAANGVKQTDIISQYNRERETTSKMWNESYKKIRLHGNKRSENFENSFRDIARSMKLGLSKTDNVDGTVTYKFYSSKINYSNVTFVNPKRTVTPAAVSSSKAVSESSKKQDDPSAQPPAPKPAVSAASSKAASSAGAKSANNNNKSKPKAKK
ncbi:MAG: hypothetical protein FWH43_03665 [Endomicrobia bacterium]|nr:hypothetical protein [Endomicrobiia bacterium]